MKRHAIQSMDAYEIKAKNQKCQSSRTSGRGEKMYNTKKNLTRQPDLFRVEFIEFSQNLLTWTRARARACIRVSSLHALAFIAGTNKEIQRRSISRAWRRIKPRRRRQKRKRKQEERRRRMFRRRQEER